MLSDYYRWSLCLVAVVFGQQQQEENSDKEILRRHGDYFLRCSYCSLWSSVLFEWATCWWNYILKTQARQRGWQACAGRGRHSEAAWAVQVGPVQEVLPSLLLKALKKNRSSKTVQELSPRGAPVRLYAGPHLKDYLWMKKFKKFTKDIISSPECCKRGHPEWRHAAFTESGRF